MSQSRSASPRKRAASGGAAFPARSASFTHRARRLDAGAPASAFGSGQPRSARGWRSIGAQCHQRQRRSASRPFHPDRTRNLRCVSRPAHGLPKRSEAGESRASKPLSSRSSASSLSNGSAWRELVPARVRDRSVTADRCAAARIAPSVPVPPPRASAFGFERGKNPRTFDPPRTLLLI